MILRLTAESPIHHGAFAEVDTGNAVTFRRTPIALPDGRHVPVPVVSGNSLRGTLRRLVMRELFDVTEIRAALADAPKAYERLYAALANGGHLEGSEASIDPKARAELRAALPPLGAFGAALYTYLLAGRFEAGFLWPVCRETAEAGVVSPSTGSLAYAEDLVVEHTHVRHIDRDDHDGSVVTPMPTTCEVLVTGTVLESHIVLRRCSPVEAACVAHGASLLTTIGAKASAGLGRVRVDIGDADPTPYRDWLAGDVGAHRSALVTLAQAMTVEKKAKKGKDA